MATNNNEGLPTIYNRVLERARNDPAIMVFVHDDVHFCDLYWVDAILNGLHKFQILGVAGNKRRAPNQCSWAFLDESFVMDQQENLTGALFRGPDYPPRILSFFGPVGQPVKLLDGVLLVAYSKTLIDSDIRFDERFKFHFYDLDFCRQAEA